MKEILILSGKGGTGKTTISSSFVSLACNCVVCDYDVDASNLPLLLHPKQNMAAAFSGGQQACINPDDCIECGLCRSICRFEAITDDFSVNFLECEGCSFCANVCPVNAITMQPRASGCWYAGTAITGQPMFYAELQPGEENSGKLVAQVKKAAWEEARDKNIKLIISDGLPGIGCPVISSLVNVDLVVVVAEPSVSGLHDLKRVKELLASRGIKAVLVINKCDLNPAIASEMEEWAEANNMPCMGKVPFNMVLADAIVRGLIPATLQQGQELIGPLWQNILKYI